MMRCHRISTRACGWLTAALLIMPAGVGAQGVVDPLRDAVVRSGGRVMVMLQSSNAGAALRELGAPPVPAAELESITERLATRFQLRERSRAASFGMVMGDIDPNQVNALLSDSNVVAVEADRLWAPTDLGDGFDPADRWAAYRHHERTDAIPYGVTQVTAPTVWAAGNRGEGIKVAVLDSGGDPTHPDLAYAGGYNAITQAASGWTDDVAVCTGHGTHVAGTIAALDNGSGVVGVAPRVQLYAIKVFEDIGGSCLSYTSAQITGLNWAVTQGIRLVNVSIGGSFSSFYDDVIRTAAANGTYVIAAAGNSGGAMTYPGTSQYAIGVGAVNSSNTRASWSSVGPQLDFSAPGVSINSTMPGGGYGVKSGTSMATPHVVGVSALILSAFPSLTFDQLYQKLRDGVLDLESAGFDNNTGYGLVRAANSIGGGPPPLVLAVSPTSRRATVQQGTGAPGDNATVTLSGTGASTAAWSATKRKAWTTLTTASGTGSGTVAWTRNASGLAVGTWVDTVTVTAVGATGSPTMVFDTLIITAPPPPLVLAVSPTSRRATVQQGTAAPGDNATVTLSGTGASTAAWSATKRKAWTTLTTASGTGSGTVTWTRNASGLAIGTWVDTVTVTAVGASGSPTTVYDTLVITAAPPPLVLGVSPSSRNVSVQQGSAAPGDNATVTLSGTGASTAAWSATKRKAWTTLTTASGTGSGTVAWTRNASGLAVGTWVDTVTVTAVGATGSPTMVFDTLVITAPPPPLVLAVSPTSRRATVQQGSAAPGDNATVTLSGTGASTAAWSATKRKAWTTLTTASGTGSGTVAWTRNASGLAVGTWVDTVTVTAIGATGSPGVVYDTLVITAAPPPLVLAVSPSSRNVSVQQGTGAPGDNATVTLSGTGASTAAWSATKRKAWTTLTAASGTGSGTVAWTRNASGLAVGTWVDTVTVTAVGATGSPTTVYDTLVITAAPPPLVLGVSPSSRNVSVQQGTAAPGDNATVTLSGTGASTAAWSATKRKAWTTLTAASGTGSGTVAWTRNASGLAVGTWVDTVTVTAVGATGSPTMVFDTLVITAPPPPLVLTLSPGSRIAWVQQGTAAPGDNASVTLSGTGASTAAWSATRRKAWTTLTGASGTGSGTVTWTRNASGLAAGTWVDTITVAAVGATGSPGVVYDTLVITAAPPPLVLGVLPGSRSVSVQQGSSASGDNSSVTLSGTGASTAAWSATKRKAWTTLTAASGIGSGTVAWTRNASGLAVGTWVDTLTVTAVGATGSPAVVYDTIRVTAVPVPVTVAVTPGSRSTSIVQGSSASGDNATILLAGDNASGASWTATKRHDWTVLASTAGTGSATLFWSRNSVGLAAGTWVDTITVTTPGSGAAAWVIDTIRVQAAITSVATNPRGRRHRVLVSSGSARILGPIADSARVEGQVADGAPDLWTASVTSSSLQLVTTSGHLSDWIHWQRIPSPDGAGLYIDSMRITLQATPAVTTILVDTLEMVSVVAPSPSAGVDELFRPGVITDDQRAVLDRDGNNNGRYDLGDFLAWVDRDQIRLSPAMVSRLMQLVVPDPAAAPRTALPARARQGGGS